MVKNCALFALLTWGRAGLFLFMVNGLAVAADNPENGYCYFEREGRDSNVICCSKPWDGVECGGLFREGMNPGGVYRGNQPESLIGLESVGIDIWNPATDAIESIVLPADGIHDAADYAYAAETNESWLTDVLVKNRGKKLPKGAVLSANRLKGGSDLVVYKNGNPDTVAAWDKANNFNYRENCFWDGNPQVAIQPKCGGEKGNRGICIGQMKCRKGGKVLYTIQAACGFDVYIGEDLKADSFLNCPAAKTCRDPKYKLQTKKGTLYEHETEQLKKLEKNPGQVIVR